MKRWIIVLSLFFLPCLLTACSGGTPQSSQPTTFQGNNITIPTTQATVITAQAISPTIPPAPPTPKPTATRPLVGHRCTLQNSCPNPWGFILGCACGKNWPKLYTPPPGFCNYFACIPDFANGHGSIAACMDGLLSHEGDLPGACSGHGGMMADLYHHISPTPTPTPTPTP